MRRTLSDRLPRVKSLLPGVALSLALVACGGASAEGPLTVPLHLEHQQLVGALKSHEYCAREELGAKGVEVFPRCDVPGTEFGQSWVIAYYDGGGRVWKLERFERYEEEARALDRFNALIEKRAASAGPPSDDAKAALSAQQELPDGTKTWVAFRTGESTLVGVFLLQPRPPQYASVLEEVVEVREQVAPAPEPAATGD
jgi:hypothetical protein